MDTYLKPEFRSFSYRSQALDREMRGGCFVPVSPQGEFSNEERPATARYPLLVLLHGVGGSYLDWPQHTNIARTLSGYGIIVAFPDGGDGWYTNAVNGEARHEDDLIQDFVPFLKKEFPVLPSGHSWGIGGLSMGGFGAIKLALKYPELFSAAISHSGALNITSSTAPHPIFGDPDRDSAARKKESVYWLAEQALCRYPTERPHLYLDCGTSDPHLAENRQFSDHLTYLGYGHEYHEMPGHHTWPYWNRAFRTILPAVARKLGAEAPTV